MGLKIIDSSQCSQYVNEFNEQPTTVNSTAEQFACHSGGEFDNVN